MHGKGCATESNGNTTSVVLAPHSPVQPHRPSFHEVYTEQFNFVWRALRLLGVPPEGLEDAAQDVFGVVFRRLGEFEGRSALATWVFAVARRVAANHHRTERRKLSLLEPLVGQEESSEPTPLARLEAAHTADSIVAFCRTLDEEHRALFVLALMEGTPVP